MDKTQCIGDKKGLTKSKIIANFITDFNSDLAVVVGDRFYDIEAGKENDCITIGCLYGYGNKSELKETDILIDNILRLKEIF